jgi:7,8-didemethyl-8-hydroxy-5-deazariboflavin synthase CofG subunit
MSPADRLSAATRAAPSPMTPLEAEAIVSRVVAGDRLDAAEAIRLGHNIRTPGVLQVIAEAANVMRRAGKGDIVTVSRNVFIPLTNLCRNRCAYCSYAKQPDSPEAHTYSLEEVAEVVRGGVMTGCTEALLCLGDKPEIAYKSYRALLDSKGYASTTDLVLDACKVAFEGDMLPHTNAGILTGEEMSALRPYNASMGLMMETTSQRLRERGQAHFHAPDKDPAVRIRMHEEAGELKIPFTTGILLGIGETVEERVETLATIRDIHDRYGHIQEVIVQPFHPKPETRMRAVSPIRDEEVVGWVAITRLMVGPKMNVQAPPNLAPDMLVPLMHAGLNDWGGVSPVTVDYINPEAPWPALERLRELTESGGLVLKDRGPVYPDWILEREDFFDPQVRAVLPRMATDEGYAKRPNRQSKEVAA